MAPSCTDDGTWFVEIPPPSGHSVRRRRLSPLPPLPPLPHLSRLSRLSATAAGGLAGSLLCGTKVSASRQQLKALTIQSRLFTMIDASIRQHHDWQVGHVELARGGGPGRVRARAREQSTLSSSLSSCELRVKSLDHEELHDGTSRQREATEPRTHTLNS